MYTIGIMGNGPVNILPDLSNYTKIVDCWIGADRGALTLLQHNIIVDYALGDFDSVSTSEKNRIKNNSNHFLSVPKEKDETDMELAIQKAYELKADRIYLFGVTGGRLDHTLVNVQQLFPIVERGLDGIIVDRSNIVELTVPGTYEVTKDHDYPNISFIPITVEVKGLTLTNFYYSLSNETVRMGSSLCISNKLLLNSGTFSYEEGILLVIKSRDSSDDS